MYVTVLIAYRA